MNCHEARELVSAYSDQELTGQQMLEIRAHLRLCPVCEREWREINEVRRLLRALASPTLPGCAEGKLAARLEYEEAHALSWLSALAPHGPPSVWVHTSAHNRRPLGRRTAYAFALASVVLLAVAAPFAPSNGDAAGNTLLSRFPRPQTVGPSAATEADSVPALRLTGGANLIESDPLHDDTISGYLQGNATMAGYEMSGVGTR